MFCLGRRDGELRERGSDLSFFDLRVGEMIVAESVGYFKAWSGSEGGDGMDESVDEVVLGYCGR
jgi:hypothetical protein